jgi:hypothetical protein
MPNLLHQTQPLLEAVAAALRGITHTPAPGPVQALRVDVDGLDGQVTTPMALVTEATGSHFYAESMDDVPCTVELRVQVTCLGSSLAQARAVRGRVLDVLVGGREETRAAITAAGLRVIRRQVEGTLPAPFLGGDWAQAVLPVALTVERAS